MTRAWRWRAACGASCARGAPCPSAPSCARTASSPRTGSPLRTSPTPPPSTTPVRASLGVSCPGFLSTCRSFDLAAVVDGALQSCDPLPFYCPSTLSYMFLSLRILRPHSKTVHPLLFQRSWQLAASFLKSRVFHNGSQCCKAFVVLMRLYVNQGPAIFRWCLAGLCSAQVRR